MRAATVFVQIDPLPGTQAKGSVADRQGKIHIGKDGSNMRGHVIDAFVDMLEHGRAIRHQVEHKAFQVGAYGRIGVFTQDQRGTGVLHKDMTQAGDDAGSGNHLLHFLGDIVSAAPCCQQAEVFLIGHD